MPLSAILPCCGFELRSYLANTGQDVPHDEPTRYISSFCGEQVKLCAVSLSAPRKVGADGQGGPGHNRGAHIRPPGSAAGSLRRQPCNSGAGHEVRQVQFLPHAFYLNPKTRLALAGLCSLFFWLQL